MSHALRDEHDAQSGRGGLLTRPSHTTRHAGPHRAVHESGAHVDPQAYPYFMMSSHRGLSPHKLMPMSGAHQQFHGTVCSLRSPTARELRR